MSRVRIQRRLFGFRLNLSARGLTVPQIRVRHAVLDKLEADSQIEVVRALHEGTLTIEELVDMDRQGKLKGADVRLNAVLRRNLWTEWAVLLHKMGGSDQTRLRYECSMNALRKRAGHWLSDDATVGDLRAVEWPVLRREWLRETSPSDWMHLRRGLSHFLSVALGDTYHPFRREILAKIEGAKERERTPELTMADFHAVLGLVDEKLRPCYVTLAMHGLRVGEYLSLVEEDVTATTLRVRVGKTGAKSIPIQPEILPAVRQAVPCPVQYSYLYHHWKAAVKQAGHPDVTLHDLRHLAGQTADAEGASIVQIMELLGHSNPRMSARYAKTGNARVAGGKVAQAYLKVVGG